MWRHALILAVAIGCDKGKAPTSLDPYAEMILPAVSVRLDPPTDRGALAMVGPVGPAYQPVDDKRVKDGVRLAVAPSIPWHELLIKIDNLRRYTSDFVLIVRTPQGTGALPFPLPRAMAGVDDDPIHVLSIARSSTGEPALFLSGRPLAITDLDAALETRTMKRLALDVDRHTQVGTVVRVLASARAVIPDVMIVRPPEAPQPMPQPR